MVAGKKAPVDGRRRAGCGCLPTGRALRARWTARWRTGSASREHSRRRAERVFSFHWASPLNQWRCPVERCPVERCQAGRRTSTMARRRANGSKKRTRTSGAGGRSPAALSTPVPLGIGMAFSMPGMLPMLTMPNATTMHLSSIRMHMTFEQHMCTHAHKRAARM